MCEFLRRRLFEPPQGGGKSFIIFSAAARLFALHPQLKSIEVTGGREKINSLEAAAPDCPTPVLRPPDMRDYNQWVTVDKPGEPTPMTSLFVDYLTFPHGNLDFYVVVAKMGQESVVIQKVKKGEYTLEDRVFVTPIYDEAGKVVLEVDRNGNHKKYKGIAQGPEEGATQGALVVKMHRECHILEPFESANQYTESP